MKSRLIFVLKILVFVIYWWIYCMLLIILPSPIYAVIWILFGKNYWDKWLTILLAGRVTNYLLG